MTEVFVTGDLSMSPSARCVYGCEKLSGWGGADALRFLGVVATSTISHLKKIAGRMSA